MQERTLYSTFAKQLIADLPRALFEGRIEVVQGRREVRAALACLRRLRTVGFDTETRPTFRKGPMNQVALMQVSSHDICFLFRLNMTGITDELADFLSDETVVKVGLSLQDDIMQLYRRCHFEPRGFVDIQTMARTMGIEDQGLQRIYANVFGMKISKGQQLTNWEADVLTEAQQRYAATDAWACLQLYEEMNRLQREGFRLVKVYHIDNQDKGTNT